MVNKKPEKALTQQEIWSRISSQWKEFRKIPKKEVEDFLKHKKGRVLDLGCGTGRHFIEQEGLKFYGTDFSQQMLELAKKKAADKGIDVELKHSGADNIPYKDCFFDYVIYIAVLHCIMSKEKRKESLKEIFRVLKPHGEVFIAVMGINSPRAKNKGDVIIPWTRDGKRYERYYYIYDKDELIRVVKSAGFKILKIWEDRNINIIAKK